MKSAQAHTSQRKTRKAKAPRAKAPDASARIIAPADDRLITTKEAAARLGMGESTFRQHRRKGPGEKWQGIDVRLLKEKRVGNDPRYLLSAVLALMYA